MSGPSKRFRLSMEQAEERRMLSAFGLSSWGQVGDDSLAAHHRSAYVARDSFADHPNQLDACARETQSVRGSVGGIFDREDVYSFNITESSAVTVRLDSMTADLDIEILDHVGRTVGRSNNARTAAEELTGRLEPGTYIAKVYPYSYRSFSPYELTVTTTVRDVERVPDLAGNSFNAAREMGIVIGNVVQSDQIGSADPADYYQFAVAATSHLSLDLTDLSADIDLYLYDSRQRLLAQSREANRLSESITGHIDSGTYYIRVSPWRDSVSDYNLSLTIDAITQPPSVSRPVAEIPTTPPTLPATNPVTAVPERNEMPEVFPSVEYYGGSHDWSLNALNAPEVWAQNITGDGVVVAVLDTGVNYLHPDLNANAWMNPDEIPGNRLDDDDNGYIDDVRGWDFVGDDNDPVDQNGHGTHVAGTIAAERNGTGATGVAYDASIMPVRVLDSGGAGSLYDIAAGIRYAVDNGADVINLSLGSGGFTTTIQSALAYADRNGVFVVAAAGNDGGSSPEYPARYSISLNNVISVGAHDVNDRMADFSNRVGNSGAVQVDAPGVNVYSTYRNAGYTRLSGTSMAAPQVAGLAALALAVDPLMTPSELRTLILDGADREIRGSDSNEGVNAAVTVASVARRGRSAAVDGYFATIG